MRIVAALFGLLSIAAVLCVAGIFFVFDHFSEGLPDYTQLEDYQPPVMTRVYAGDGRLLAEYAIENRVFVPIEVIPEPLIHAFLSAEDQHFYLHPGVDPIGIDATVKAYLDAKVAAFAPPPTPP